MERILTRDSINRPQIQINRKTRDIRTWKKIFFSRHVLHQHWYTCLIDLRVRRNPQHRSLFICFPSHFHTSVSTSSQSAKNLPLSCEPLYATNTSYRTQEIFLYEYSLHWILLPTENTHIRTLLFVPQVRSPFWLLKPASELSNTQLLPRLPWSWTVLLPSDTHRKCALFSFVTYSLTSPRIKIYHSETLRKMSVS
jgi:hypothetical protein